MTSTISHGHTHRTAIPAVTCAAPPARAVRPWLATRSGPRNPLALLLLTLLLALTLLTPPLLQAHEPRMAALRTRYYRIHTDLEPEFARDLARRLDGMY